MWDGPIPITVPYSFRGEEAEVETGRKQTTASTASSTSKTEPGIHPLRGEHRTFSPSRLWRGSEAGIAKV